MLGQQTYHILQTMKVSQQRVLDMQKLVKKLFIVRVCADGTLGIGTRGIDNTVAQPHVM